MKIAAGLAKISVPLKADEVDFSSVLVPEPKPQPDVTLRIDAGGVPLKVTFKGKNFRKSMKAVIPGCFCMLSKKFTRLKCLICTPFGLPVDPDVYNT